MKAQESKMEYHKNREIQIFHSFKDASEKEAKDIIRQPPIERLKNTVELILRAYRTSREGLQHRVSGAKIKIRRQA